MITAGGDISYTKAVLYGQDISHLTKDQLESLTSIDNPLLTVPVDISDKSVDGEQTTIALEATFTNANLKADLPYKAVGFFAKKDNGEEKLVILGVANSGAYLAAASPDGVASDALDVKVAIAIGDATNVTAVVDPAGSVTPATLNGAINKATHDLTAKIDTKADQATVTRDLAIKANLADVYTKTELDPKIASAGKVKTVNNVQPDSNGNISISIPDISGKADKTDVNNLQAMVTGLSTKVDSVVTKLSDGTLAKVAHFKASEEQKAVDWSKDDGKGGLPKIGIIDG